MIKISIERKEISFGTYVSRKKKVKKDDKLDITLSFKECIVWKHNR